MLLQALPHRGLSVRFPEPALLQRGPSDPPALPASFLLLPGDVAGSRAWLRTPLCCHHWLQVVPALFFASCCYPIGEEEEEGVKPSHQLPACPETRQLGLQHCCLPWDLSSGSPFMGSAGMLEVVDCGFNTHPYHSSFGKPLRVFQLQVARARHGGCGVGAAVRGGRG